MLSKKEYIVIYVPTIKKYLWRKDDVYITWHESFNPLLRSMTNMERLTKILILI